MKTPWEKFSLPGDGPAYARGDSAEFRRTLREIFGPLVDHVDKWPAGELRVGDDGSAVGRVAHFLFRDLQKRLTSAGSLWVVFPKKPYLADLQFPYSWTDVQKSGLSCGLVDNKIAAFSARLTSIRFVVPLALRKSRK